MRRMVDGREETAQGLGGKCLHTLASLLSVPSKPRLANEAAPYHLHDGAILLVFPFALHPEGPWMEDKLVGCH